MKELALLGPVLLAYVVAAFFYGRFVLRLSQRAGRWAFYAAVAGWAMHSLALALRTVQAGRPPLNNLFEFTAFYTWLLVLVFLVLERGFDQRTLGAFVMPLVVVLVGVCAFLPAQVLATQPVLESSWLPVHVGFSIVAYAFLTASFATSAAFLVHEGQLRARRPHGLSRRLPPLETTERLSFRLVELGFPFLLLTIITGAFWSQTAWGSYWSWEPKQTAALVTLLVYVAYFHARTSAGWRGRRGAWLMVIGFASVLATFLGVSVLAPGLHQFAV